MLKAEVLVVWHIGLSRSCRVGNMTVVSCRGSDRIAVGNGDLGSRFGRVLFGVNPPDHPCCRLECCCCEEAEPRLG